MNLENIKSYHLENISSPIKSEIVIQLQEEVRLFAEEVLEQIKSIKESLLEIENRLNKLELSQTILINKTIEISNYSLKLSSRLSNSKIPILRGKDTL